MAIGGREVFVGIDVRKDRLEVHIRPLGQHRAVANDEAGLALLALRLEAHAPHLILLEASGGYERLAAIGLVDRGWPVAVVNPRQTRKFAAALRQLAKTDRIDAAMLAHFADAIRPAARADTDDAIDPLQKLLARRRQLVVMRNAEKQRLGKATDPITRRSLKAMITALDKQLDWIDQAIRRLIEAGPALAEKLARLKTVPGIGDVSARTCARRVARARPSQPARNRRALRGRADPSRQRALSWPAQDPGWPGRGQGALVHGDAGCDPAQSRHPAVLSTPARCRQARQGRARRLHAQPLTMLNAMLRDR